MSDRARLQKYDARVTLRKLFIAPAGHLSDWVQGLLNEGELQNIAKGKKSLEQARIIKSIASDQFIGRALDTDGDKIFEEEDLKRVEQLDGKKGLSESDLLQALNNYKENIRLFIEHAYYLLLSNKFKGGSMVINTYAPSFRTDGRISVDTVTSYPEESEQPLDRINPFLQIKAMEIFQKASPESQEFIKNAFRTTHDGTPVRMGTLKEIADENNIEMPRIKIETIYDEEEKKFLQPFPTPEKPHVKVEAGSEM